VRQALRANPDLQAQRSALNASRSDITTARSDRYPSVGFTGFASRYDNGEGGSTNRRDLGISVHQTLYRGGRVSAGVGAAESAFAAEAAAVDAARSDLILAVRQAWYQAAQAHRLVISSEQGLERSRLNLEFAEAQLLAGLGTRTDVLRARVDVSAADLDLTKAGNAVETARATLNTLMGQSPARPLELALDADEEPLSPLSPWEELRRTALETREELRVAQARTARQEAAVRVARGGFLPTLNADGGVNWGVTGSQGPKDSWSVGLAVSLPLFEGFARSAELQVQKALLEAARFDEQTARQQVEREVWEALLAEDASTRTLENARSLFEAAQENLDGTQESYRQGLSSMIALVDARTAFTDAERILIQAEYGHRIAYAVLDRAIGRNLFREEWQ
jgi:outer membrane protein TolC